ncbi:DUF397 domain-containing protein [Nocardia sp. NBC_00881]|uniref:DUF397 domain-containing protein n=1 Tax=Nocardia sp. NBC_00881 TaxID=2975995 RepID=UPI00386496B4|nr:DUF397 domain-containing protein [Nocardia sp. NBC_00881]
MISNTRLDEWKTSTFSGNNGGACVEVKIDGDKVLVRDTKFRRNPANTSETQPQIEIPAGLWPEVCNRAVSMTSFKVGDALTVTIHADGAATFSGPDADLNYTPDEVDAFAKGVIDGQFDLP